MTGKCKSSGGPLQIRMIRLMTGLSLGYPPPGLTPVVIKLFIAGSVGHYIGVGACTGPVKRL